MGGARCSAWLLVVLVGCAKGGTAEPADAPSSDGACNTVWYADVDEDGHGDPGASVPACEQPAKTVATDDDCDDKDRYRYPGAPEVCDGVDNDCNAATFEMCPASCQPVKRPAPDNGPTYLMCNTAQNWTNARNTCASVMGFHLIQIDDMAENLWLRGAANTAFGTIQIFIGSSDTAAEGVWRWDGSNAQFWQGGSGGMTVDSRFAAWGSGEPNDDDGEDCGELRTDGLWNDLECGDARRFVCER